MKPDTLPTENAHEPNERAHQPGDDAMTPHLQKQPSRRLISFAVNADSGDNESSQRSSSYRDVLSQPPQGLSHKQKLLWLQQRRSEGLWVQCDDCDKWRYLPDILDKYELPTKWYCRMNPDARKAHCSIPETPIPLRDEEDLIYSEYSAGSVVWAHLTGFPWWPAMVDDCPDIEQFYWLDGFSDIPTHYNVVFFDSKDVTRAWISTSNLKPYIPYKRSLMPFTKDIKFKNRLRTAVFQADDASQLSVADRLQKYSFLTRFKGDFKAPKQLTVRDLAKHQNILKRKLNIEFESDSNSSLEDEWQPAKANVILLGTPKNRRSKAGRTKSGDGNKQNSKENKQEKEKKVKTDQKAVAKTKDQKIIQEKEVKNSKDNETTEQKTSHKSKVLVEEGKTETENLDEADGVFKEPSSLAVQKGSLVDSVATESFDDDTSKTYVPETNTEESTGIEETDNAAQATEFQVRAATPGSDDFDF